MCVCAVPELYASMPVSKLISHGCHNTISDNVLEIVSDLMSRRGSVNLKCMIYFLKLQTPVCVLFNLWRSVEYNTGTREGQGLVACHPKPQELLKLRLCALPIFITF